MQHSTGLTMAFPGEPDAQSRTFTVSQSVPSAGLFQLSYSLSEANFLRLTSGNPTLLAVGAALLGLGLTSGAPVLVTQWLVDGGQRWRGTDTAELFAAAVFLVLGSTLSLWGTLWSRERSSLVRSIRKHFADNPEKRLELS